MPTICRVEGYQLFFYSNEGTPREPPHVHVERGEGKAKFWLRPVVEPAYSKGFSRRELRELMAIVRERRELIEERWHGFFG